MSVTSGAFDRPSRDVVDSALFDFLKPLQFHLRGVHKQGGFLIKARGETDLVSPIPYILGLYSGSLPPALSSSRESCLACPLRSNELQNAELDDFYRDCFCLTAIMCLPVLASLSVER